MRATGLDPVCAHCVDERNDLAPAIFGGREVMLCGTCRDAFAEGDLAYLLTCNAVPDRSQGGGAGAGKPTLDDLDREAM